MKALARLSGAEKWVLVMTVLTLMLAIASVGRGVVALRYAAQIPGLETRRRLVCAAGSGLFWGVALVVCAGGLLAARAWGRVSTLATVTLYQAHIWLNRLRFDVSDYARQTRPRDLVLTAALLLIYWGTLSLRPIRRVFSGDRCDEEQVQGQAEAADPAGKEID